jgi:hypothetical protein
MDHSPTDDPDYVDREITRVLLRASENPGDVWRLLERLAATLELTAARVPVPEESDRFFVCRNEKRE